MLSLLSLLLASGTVLRADTEEWTPLTYPDPRTNFTLCNTWSNSTLCDPDHILTDHWRSEINNNIIRQIEKLKDANILYTDDAPLACHENTTGIQIFVILAKRIQTTSNQTITNQELIDFGDKLAEQYRLTEQDCKNYLLLIGIEAAKTAYTRTGRHLKLPDDLMVRIYNQSENVFKEKNYMEGLNKMIDEIGEQMIDPFKDESTEAMIGEQNSTTIEIVDEVFNITTEVYLESTTEAAEKIQIIVTPWWMFLVMAAIIIVSITALTVLCINKLSIKRLQMQTIVPLTRSDTVKSSSPSDQDDNSHGRRFATITILRELGMDDPTPDLSEHRDNNYDVEALSESTTEEDDRREITVIEEEEESEAFGYKSPPNSPENESKNAHTLEPYHHSHHEHRENSPELHTNREMHLEDQKKYTDNAISAF